MTLDGERFLYGATDASLPLRHLLAVDLADNTYRNRVALLNPGGVTFGGQLAANCLSAACAASPGYAPASLHVSFLGAGDPSRYFTYDVVQRRNGRRLSHLTVTGTQSEKPVVDAIVTLADHGGLLDHGPRLALYPASAPPSGPPDGAEDRRAILAASTNKITAIDRLVLRSFGFLDIRDVSGARRMSDARQNAGTAYWFRVPSSGEYTPEEHYILLTLISDFWFSLPMFSQLERRRAAADIAFVSLDHTIWFHGSPQCDKWLLIEAELLVYAQARTLCRAKIVDEQGRPVATVIQDGLMTARSPAVKA